MAAIIFNAHNSTLNISSLNSVVKEIFSWRKKKKQDFFSSWNLGRRDISHHGTMKQTIGKNGTQETFETKQANDCLPHYFIMADNRITQKTKWLPEWYHDHKRIKTQRAFLRDSRIPTCTGKTLLLWSQLFFLQMVYNSKQFPLLNCLDCLIVILLSYKLILTWLIQSHTLPAPYMITMRFYFHFVPSPGL